MCGCGGLAHDAPCIHHAAQEARAQQVANSEKSWAAIEKEAKESYARAIGQHEEKRFVAAKERVKDAEKSAAPDEFGNLERAVAAGRRLGVRPEDQQAFLAGWIAYAEAV